MIQDLCDAAKPWYDFNRENRQYHNWDHAVSVASSLPGWGFSSVLLAAYWHDAVYVPGAQEGANENCSAAALIATSRNFPGVPHHDVMIASDLIRKTTISWHLASEENLVWCDERSFSSLSNLLDADLSSLAASYDVFLWNQRNIISENGGEWTPENIRKSADFLGQFLTRRKFIYHTERARKRWEVDAKANIIRYQKFAVDIT